MKPLTIFAGALIAALLSSGAASAQQFTMRLSSPTINDVTHEWMKAFKSGVEKRSNGRVKVEIYPANQLGQIPATVEGVALGTIQFTVPAVGFLIGLEPRFQGSYVDPARRRRGGIRADPPRCFVASTRRPS